MKLPTLRYEAQKRGSGIYIVLVITNGRGSHNRHRRLTGVTVSKIEHWNKKTKRVIESIAKEPNYKRMNNRLEQYKAHLAERMNY